ncbi:hypothetical protein OOZ15_16110 [Galbibacter sp. EGI 63066]|uniref:hypothetical protein n=1 Tax=Galbibacter sp. EGI 63066 TaxID=2993559 RepID=UPI002248F30C|nr:hypothetical protein [Galbibacter sp. EGI 63066]MCX2681480.1 hypothetical protein [Galbibacter sp. EGI 63066]
MKKLLLVVIATLGIAFTTNAQSFSLGAHLGIPVGDASDFSNFNAGVDATYFVMDFPAVDLGISSGYTHFFTEDYEEGGIEVSVDDISFIPIAASARASLGSLLIGADLGYGIGVNDGNDGGLYYQGRFGFGLPLVDIYAYYKGFSIDDADVDINSLGVGAAIKL